MAATAAAAISSSFSPSIHTLKCTNSKHLPSDSLLRLPSAHRVALASIYHRSYAIEPLSQVAVSWRSVARLVSAAVAQEEAAVTAPVEEDEQQQVAEEGEAEPEAEPEAAPINTKLYFGNLPYNVDSAQLAGIIQDYGTPELVEVLYDRDTGRSRGFAFVTMSTVEDCNAVIENLDGSQFMGRILRVNFSDKPKPKEPLYPETEHKLFVGNLSWSVTSESLVEAFQEYGNIVGARVLYDGETGRSRGYGFVCYATRSEMENALVSLNGVELEGRAMRVSLAQGKKS
ncbi:30 kDa ribonucleoprotein, chloroplastic [Ricinus communis]|uniref:Ribonucleoprotein, chloroplast, putative n=1 Tax=Ricinus communis TaxID=3988 RepID=B9SQT1_RICCO|nr:30 kDa ribonucleoprotein, chloroplastic [Ricinus communis]EEF34022.1 ribonucleoprotein, chloroplast, putative [Ricinus communis]|eukprot:XP_002528350.1 30 kDa ribonucleoprotein, chloroplastic [Ricinus communis]